MNVTQDATVDEDECKLYILLASYTGTDFYGVQYQRNKDWLSIENVILEALDNMKMIPTMNASALRLHASSRTDRGVHALRNVICLRMIVDRVNRYDHFDEFCEELNIEIASVNNKHPVANGEQRTPIRNVRIQYVMGVQQWFNAINWCSSRSYHYWLPKRIIKHKFNSDEECISRMNEILALYNGKQSFHNFTDTSDIQQQFYRKMYSICIHGVTSVQNEEYYIIKLHGQGFMKHQIRKMMGLTLAVLLEYCPDKCITESLDISNKAYIPTAPGIYLMLEAPDFQNRLKWAKHVESKISLFEPIIHAEINRVDMETNSIESFIAHDLDRYRFNAVPISTDEVTTGNSRFRNKLKRKQTNSSTQTLLGDDK
jgi:tRNA pseudouridine38-40 synthase